MNRSKEIKLPPEMKLLKWRLKCGFEFSWVSGYCLNIEQSIDGTYFACFTHTEKGALGVYKISEVEWHLMPAQGKS